MSVISILSVYSKYELLAKKGSSENLYEVIVALLHGLVKKRDLKLLYGIKEGDFMILKSRVEKKLSKLLEERENSPPEIANWEGRFERSDIFHSRKIFNKEYELYSGGIDSCIWGVSTILDMIDECESLGKKEILIFYSEKRQGLRRIKNKLSLIKSIRSNHKL